MKTLFPFVWHRRIVVALGILLAGWLATAWVRPAASAADVPQAPSLELKRGDRICIVGNTLAERMQHDGWLETLLQLRFPKHELVVRNLGFSGDELTLRLRSAGFGSPDDHLRHSKATVVFAFFGYNESYQGEAGLPKFRQDLENFIKHTQSQKYNGTDTPRVVVFSPIAHEDLGDPNLPDGRENNARLELYTAAMAEVAAASGAVFVDLFHPTQQLYARHSEPLTINGVHLNELGNRLVAEAIDRALFPQAAPQRDPQLVEKVRSAVLEKNFYWYQRYRTVDGYSIYGGRADLKFVNGQTNRVVMQREMEVLDVMTANRDRRVWAAAQGDDLKADDSNAPPFIPVITNKPGPGPNGEHLFLSGEEAIAKMTVHDGMQVQLFASEEQFPELANPVQMCFDTKGRLWVAAMPSYPHWKPDEVMDDKVLILEDTDGDGRADKCTTFVGGLHVPTGLELWGGGVFVGGQPDLLFFKDTDGDDRADIRRRVLHGIDSADTHHAMNSFVLGPGGELYFQEGTFHHTQVETPWRPPVRSANAGVFRYEPRTHKFEVYVPYGFANPHGHVFDRWGQDFVTDGTGNVNYYAAAFSGHTDFPAKHPGIKPFFQQRTRPCPATEILSSRHFPESMQGNYLVCNVIGFQGILRYQVEDDGAGFSAKEQDPILFSSDPNFRPVDLEVGPDGALYFLDWQNPIIGHMQHNLRDPSRDRTHGRVYRVTYQGRDLLTPPRIAGQPIGKLLDLLKEPEDRTRYRARIELSARDSDEVIAAVGPWLDSLDPNDPEYEHHVLEGLWVHQQHNRVNVELLKRVLGSPDHRARAAATRVLCYWRDRVPESLQLLRKLAADAHPRVRLEAVRAASFFTDPAAIEIPLISAEYPSDYWLEYVRNETMKTLQPYWKRALSEGREIPLASDAGARFFLRNVSLADLLKMERSRAVCLELLYRPGVADQHRRAALVALAALEKKDELHVLLSAINDLSDKQRDRDLSVVYDLVRLLTGRRPAELATVRQELQAMATGDAELPLVRQVGFVALLTADAKVEPAWELALQSTRTLQDLVQAVPLVPDPSLRTAMYPRLTALLEGLPEPLSQGASPGKGAFGRYVRIELPRKGTLTLAEVEVYSDGRNIARGGKASQKNTAHGGDASKAIDGKTDGAFGAGGQTHTAENTDRPWWEVDLGEERPIERIVIYNRTDGDLGKRLEGFTLSVLDAARQPVAVRENNPAPKDKMELDLGGAGPEGLIRRAAMHALTFVRGKETETFNTLAQFVRNDIERLAAIRALQRIPATYWDKQQVPALVESVAAYVQKFPQAERTSPAALDALQLGESLAALLPAEQAKKVRAQLGELGVTVIRLSAVPHRMLYDKERLAVRAGKPVEITFENADLMPHNLVLVEPGALEEVGLLAEATATQPDALQRQFVPKSDKILVASRLLQPREMEKIAFTAPTKPGIYPYVCTYPGHWRRMYGALYVVEDLDEYRADPEAYVALHGLEIQDTLLKFNRPAKAWKLEDLAPLVAELNHGRSYAVGKQMFQLANCVACHRMEEVGNVFGPDLTKLDAKLKPLDILKEIVEPSSKINEKFVSSIIETASGKVITGLVVEETKQSLKIIENPLANTQPTEIPIDEIESRQKAKNSIMPQGLLDKLSREEILDLLAYVIARGNPDHPIFSGGHHGGEGGHGEHSGH